MRMEQRTLTGLALAVLVGLGSAASAQDSDPNTGVVSDGRTIRPATSTRTFSPSATGSGTASEAAGALARPESAGDLAALLALQAVTGPVGAETIIGADTRRRVTPTTGFPARATALVVFSAGRCTGWLIGPDTVVTAGHCVHPGDGGAFYPVRQVRVYPGRNGNTSPYGSCGARWTASTVGWTRSARDDYDYGVIKLNCRIGETTGWYGFFWTSTSLTGLPTTINGYPGDKPLTQWRSDDLVRVTQTRRVFHQNDTVGGVSGAPIYNRRAGCGICGMAVHAYGTYGSPPFSTNNHGTRITRAVFNNLLGWRNAS